jgi:hypothetical protein
MNRLDAAVARSQTEAESSSEISRVYPLPRVRQLFGISHDLVEMPQA